MVLSCSHHGPYVCHARFRTLNHVSTKDCCQPLGEEVNDSSQAIEKGAVDARLVFNFQR